LHFQKDPAIGSNATDGREMIVCLFDIENWGLSAWSVCGYKHWQEIKTRLIVKLENM